MRPMLGNVCGQIDALTFVSGFLLYKIKTRFWSVDIKKKKDWDSSRARRQEDFVTMKYTKSEKWVFVKRRMIVWKNAGIRYFVCFAAGLNIFWLILYIWATLTKKQNILYLSISPNFWHPLRFISYLHFLTLKMSRVNIYFQSPYTHL